MEQLFNLLFIGLSVAGIIVGCYLLFSRFTLAYVNTNFLKAWLVIVMCQIAFYLLNINGILPKNHLFNLFGFPLSLLQMPLFYLAIIHLTNLRKIKFTEVFVHMIPYVLYVGFLIYLNNVSISDVIVSNGFIGIPSDIDLSIRKSAGLPLALSGAIYAILCLVAMYQYKKKLRSNLSNIDAHQLNWITYLVWTIVALFLVIYGVITASADYELLSTKNTFKWVNIFLFFFLAFFGIKYQRQLIYFLKNQVAPLEESVKSKYVKSSLTETEMKTITLKLDNLMQKEKIYLDEYLTLQEVANALNESTQNISQTLNEHLETNFYNYVNNYRLTLIEKRLLDPAYNNLSIIGIAMDSGFKSKSTFYKLFKQKTGKTPVAFRKAH